MFAVRRDHERASEQVEVENLPHIEFLNNGWGRVSHMIKTRQMNMLTVPK